MRGKHKYFRQAIVRGQCFAVDEARQLNLSGHNLLHPPGQFRMRFSVPHQNQADFRA